MSCPECKAKTRADGTPAMRDVGFERSGLTMTLVKVKCHFCDYFHWRVEGLDKTN